jgi:cytochrome c556
MFLSRRSRPGTSRRAEAAASSGERTMTRRLPTAVAAALLCAAAAALTVARPPEAEKAPPWREVLPAKELAPLAAQLSAALKKPVGDLVGGKLDEDDRERAVKKARGLALLLAVAAQTTEGKGAGSELRGPLHSAAGQLDRALRGGKFADAGAVVAALPAGKGFEKSAFAPAPLTEARHRDDALAALMAQCRVRPAGGLGVEPQPKNKDHDGLEGMLKALGDTGNGGLKPDEIARFAYRLAVLAEATRALPPPRPVAAKTPAKWLSLAAEMRDTSLELADAARKDPAAVSKAALRVGSSCTECHKVFRDN